MTLVPASSSALRRWALVALAAGLALFAAGTAAAPAARADDTIVVDSPLDPGDGECDEGGECSLREAIELVNEGEVSGDVRIEIPFSGSIELEAGELFINPEEEAVDSVTIAGSGPDDLVVDGLGESRVFFVAGGNVTIAGLGVTGGNLTGFTLDGTGGAGLFQAEGNVRVENARFSENEVDSARQGGAIAVEEGDLTVVDTVVTGNTTDADLDDGQGGRIYSESDGTLTLEQDDVSNNTAGGSAGGGVYQADGKMTIGGGSFENNHASGGGGIATGGDSSTTIEGALIAGNEAGVAGGGIDSQGAELTLLNSTVSGNWSEEYGGDGVQVERPTTIEGSTISGNGTGTGGGEEGGEPSAIGVEGELSLSNSTVAENAGVGIEALSGTTTIRGSTIAANHAAAGETGGIGGAGAVSMVSSVLALNEASGAPADCATTIESRGDNLLQTTAGCDWEAAAGDVFNADPQLGALAENGGATKTMGPVSRESAVINNGSEPLASDQRGFTRPVPAGAVNTDVGAFEVQAPENQEPPLIGPFDEEVGPVVGETLTCMPGTWDTDTVADALASYAWFSGGVEVGTGDSYVVANSDAGQEIECEETVEDGATGASARSEAVELQPALAHLEPTALDLGERKVGTGPGPAQTLILTNEGAADLEVSDISSDDPQFTVAPLACTVAPIGPGESCAIEVAFAPTEPGAQFATLTVTGNGGEQQAELSGTGTAPATSVTPGFHDFGQQLVGGPSAPQTFVVTNTGTASMTLGEVGLGGDDPAAFAKGEDTCSAATLEPGGECTVDVAFAPPSATGFSATLLIPGEAPTASAGLEGLGVQPAFSSAPTSVDFGSQQVGGGAGTAEAISVVNSGSAPLEIGTVTLAGADAGDFAIESDGCSDETLTPEGECTVAVAFAPTATGERTASLVLPGNVPTYTVPLKGTGTEPVFSVAPTSFDFGSELVGGTSLSHSFTVTNAGSAPLFIGQVALAGADAGAFAIDFEDCGGASLAPGEECTVDVTFKPTAVGDLSARLELSGNAPTASAELEGTGVAPTFSVSPTAVDFGSRLVGLSGPAEAVTVTNSGSAPLEIGTVLVTGVDPADFAIEADGCEGETLAPSGECTVAVAFAPTATGARNASLVLSGNAPSASVPLQGTGTIPVFAASPASLDFGTAQVGNSAAAQTVTLTSAGSGPVTVGQVSIAGEAPGSFAIVAGSDECSGETLAPTSTCTVEVAFAPVAAGSLEATLVFAGSAPSYFVSLHGDGSVPPPPPDPGPNTNPAPQPPQPPAAPPSARLRPHSSPYEPDAKGKVTLMVTCESAGGSPCAATLTLLPAKAKGLPRKLGSAKATLVPGASRRVAIKLSGKAIAALKERGRLPAVASVATAGGTSSRTQIVLVAP